MQARRSPSGLSKDPVLLALAVGVALSLWQLGHVAFANTLASSVAALVAGGAALVVSLLLIPAPAKSPDQSSRRLIVGGLLALAGATTGALLRPEISGAGLALVGAGLVTIASVMTATALLLHQRPQKPNIPDRAQSAPVAAPAAGLLDLHDVSALPFEEAEEEIDPLENATLVQSWSRRVTEEGAEIIQGEWLVDFPAGTRQAVLHIPLSPPLPTTPEATCLTLDDSPISFEADVCQPYGVRFVARRSGPIQRPLKAQVEVFIASHSASQADVA